MKQGWNSMGIVYLDFSYGRDLPPKILTDLGVEKPEEYGENFMRLRWNFWLRFEMLQFLWIIKVQP